MDLVTRLIGLQSRLRSTDKVILLYQRPRTDDVYKIKLVKGSGGPSLERQSCIKQTFYRFPNPIRTVRG